MFKKHFIILMTCVGLLFSSQVYSQDDLHFGVTLGGASILGDLANDGWSGFSYGIHARYHLTNYFSLSSSFSLLQDNSSNFYKSEIVSADVAQYYSPAGLDSYVANFNTYFSDFGIAGMFHWNPLERVNWAVGLGINIHNFKTIIDILDENNQPYDWSDLPNNLDEGNYDLIKHRLDGVYETDALNFKEFFDWSTYLTYSFQSNLYIHIADELSAFLHFKYAITRHDYLDGRSFYAQGINSGNNDRYTIYGLGIEYCLNLFSDREDF